MLTYKLDTTVYSPYGNRIGIVILRTVYYAVATTLRLLYMLVAMYFNTGLFLVLVGDIDSCCIDDAEGILY